MQTQYRRRGALHVTPRSDRRKTWSRTSTSAAATHGHSAAQAAAGGCSWADGGSMADAAAAVSPAPGGEGGLAELEGPAGDVLKDARAAGCEHGMLWAVTDSALHVMSAYDVSAGPGSACPDQPVVRASVPLSQLIGDRPCPGEIAATVMVLFPFVFTMHPSTATPTAPLCVVLVGSLSKVLLVSLGGDGTVVSLDEGGGVPPELFDSPFAAACSVLQRGVAVANDVGETFYVEVNPTAFNFNRQGVCILSKMQDQGGLLSSLLSYAAGPTAAVSRLFFGGGGSRPQGDATGDARAGRSPIVALLCNPVGGGGDAQSVFIVSKTGRVVQCTIGEEDEGEESAGYTPPAAAAAAAASGGRVVSEGLSSFVEDGAAGAEVAAACLSFPPGSLSVARLNLLVCYADAAGQTTLALARISCTAPTPIYKRAVVLQEGGVAAARYRLFLEDSDTAAQERVVLVSRGDGNTHITKIPIKHWAARGCYTGCEDEEEDPNAMADDAAAAADSRIVPGYCVAVSESTCPLPERVVVATTAGSYGTEPLSSLCFSAMRRELSAGGTVTSEPAAAAAAAAAALAVSPAAASPLAASSPMQGAGGCSSASSVSGVGGEESALLQLLNGDLGVSSTAVVDEAVVDATQWTALTDTHDRASHMLLSKVRVKLDKAEFILEAAKKRTGSGGVGAETFCTVADNYEKAAVSLALREMQSRLYTDVSAGKWQATELARLISDHSTTRTLDAAAPAATAAQQHADLHLTPLQAFYTETRHVGGFFAFLEGQMAEKAAAAASVSAEEAASPADEEGGLGYTAFCARLLSHVLDRLEPAKSYAASLPENQLLAVAGAGAAPVSPAGVEGCRAEQGLYDALQRRRLVQGRWTHDPALLDSLRGIATHLHAAACATTAAVAAGELRRRRLQAVSAAAPAAEVAAAAAAAEEENLRAAVLSTLKRVVRFVATQEVEALAASLDGAPLDAAAARALRELRRAHAAWTTEVFGLGGVDDAAADAVETLRAVTASEPYLLARDLGRELPDFVLLVRLAHMVPDARRRTEELRASLRHSPALFFEAVVAFYLAERPGREFAGLLELPATLGLSEAELATMRAVAQADLPADFAKKPAAVGPVVGAAGEDEDAAAAGAALLRGAAAAATLASANAQLTVAQRLAKLKAAKFSCLAAAAAASAASSAPYNTSTTTAAASSPELDAVTAHITLLKVHQHILRCASPHPHTADKLFAKLLAGPVEGGAKWETASLADCVEGTVGHSLAWAFPLIPMLKASAANEQACRTEVWVKAMTTPKGWWEAREYSGILDKV